jgi:hypothetical protein
VAIEIPGGAGSEPGSDPSSTGGKVALHVVSWVERIQISHLPDGSVWVRRTRTPAELARLT